jgi:peroxisomal 2,4-dienoyl-CoA reductase
VIVDGGFWLSQPRYLPKEAVRQVSRAIEKRSRDEPVGVPKSKL